MLEDLLPKGLTEAARRLGVEPPEVVRLMVVTDISNAGKAVKLSNVRVRELER